MKVLFLCNAHSWGGAEAYLQSIARCLAKRGHAVFLAAPPSSPLFQAGVDSVGVNTLPLQIGPKLSRRSAADMALRYPLYRAELSQCLTDWTKRYGVEIVHLQFKKEQMIASRLARQLGIPVVWTEHDRLPRPLAALRPARSFYVHASKHVNTIICVSNFVKENLLSYGLHPDLLTVCHNGIDPVAPDPAPGRLRDEFGFETDDLVVASASRLVWTKGIKHFLEAIPSVLRLNPNTRFLIAGDGPEREELENTARQMGLAGSVLFIGHRTDIPAILDTVDIFVCPSLQEGMPFSILEAMRAGKPVVATRTGGVPEVIRSNVDGFLVDVGDIRALAGTVKTLVADPDLRNRIGQAARQRVTKNFSTQSMVDCTEDVFHQALYTHSASRIDGKIL